MIAMYYQNCPRCNMVLAPGAQSCPNCQLNLAQYAYQHQQMAYQAAVPPADVVTKKEGHYRKLLLIIAMLLFGDFLVYRIPELMTSWFGVYLYSWTKPFTWLLTFAWAGLPLAIALILPKKDSIRTLLIVFASIYAAWYIGHFVYYEFFYNGWGVPDSDAFNNF